MNEVSSLRCSAYKRTRALECIRKSEVGMQEAGARGFCRLEHQGPTSDEVGMQEASARFVESR